MKSKNADAVRSRGKISLKRYEIVEFDSINIEGKDYGKNDQIEPALNMYEVAIFYKTKKGKGELRCRFMADGDLEQFKRYVHDLCKGWDGEDEAKLIPQFNLYDRIFLNGLKPFNFMYNIEIEDTRTGEIYAPIN